MGGIDITESMTESTKDTNEQANIVGMTTIGTNTYNKGALANMYGAYSVITGDFTGEGGTNSWDYGPQNFGANVVGSLNSIRSKGHSGSSGIANSIVGVANTVKIPTAPWCTVPEIRLPIRIVISALPAVLRH